MKALKKCNRFRFQAGFGGLWKRGGSGAPVLVEAPCPHCSGASTQGTSGPAPGRPGRGLGLPEVPVWTPGLDTCASTLWKLGEGGGSSPYYVCVESIIISK